MTGHVANFLKPSVVTSYGISAILCSKNLGIRLPGGGHWGLRYCGIGQFFMRYFGNYNFKLRYCGVLRICGMRYFWRFGQRYLIKKKRFPTLYWFDWFLIVWETVETS